MQTDELAALVKEALRDDYTDVGMEDAFFRWPVIERAILTALRSDRDPAAVEAAFREGFNLGDFAGGGKADPRTASLAWQNSRARLALQEKRS